VFHNVTHSRHMCARPIRSVDWPGDVDMTTSGWPLLLAPLSLQALQSMGVRAAFSPGADFSKAVQSHLYLSDARQAVSDWPYTRFAGIVSDIYVWDVERVFWLQITVTARPGRCLGYV
jgi:hypothetical protein